MQDLEFTVSDAGSIIGASSDAMDWLARRLQLDREKVLRIGFADCEALLLVMLQEMTGTESERAADARERTATETDPRIATAWAKKQTLHEVRAGVLGEIELAVRMGQHRSAEYGDPDLMQKAHMRAANGSAKGRAGGIKAAGNMTKEERVRRAKQAAEARYDKRKQERKGEKK